VSAVHIVTNSLIINAAGNLSVSRAVPERLCCHETVFSFFLNYSANHCWKYSGPYKEQLGGQWSPGLLPKVCAHNRKERNPNVITIPSFGYLVAVNPGVVAFVAKGRGSREQTEM